MKRRACHFAQNSVLNNKLYLLSESTWYCYTCSDVPIYVHIYLKINMYQYLLTKFFLETLGLPRTLPRGPC